MIEKRVKVTYEALDDQQISGIGTYLFTGSWKNEADFLVELTSMITQGLLIRFEDGINRYIPSHRIHHVDVTDID